MITWYWYWYHLHNASLSSAHRSYLLPLTSVQQHNSSSSMHLSAAPRHSCCTKTHHQQALPTPSRRFLARPHSSTSSTSSTSTRRPRFLLHRSHSSMSEEGSGAHASTARLDALVQDGIVWASQHGLVVGLGGSSAPPVALIHAPLSLLPVAFPQERFNQAKAAMTAFNTLIDAVAADEPYLQQTLAKAAQQDDFTARLLDLMAASAPARAAAAAAAADTAGGAAAAAAAAGGGGVPGVLLGVHRSDYMLDAPSGGFLQVELNTIASSFGCLSTLTTQLHTYTLGRLAAAAAGGGQHPDAAPQQQEQQLQLLSQQRLPPNDATAGIARALAAATKAAGGDNSVLVMIVQPGERNAYDQQWLQTTLWQQHGVVSHRVSLGEVAAVLELRPLLPQQQQQQQQQQLVLRSTGQVVGCVYYRAGYTPADYPTDKEWQARALIESSTACKCPSVTYQLAGCKKVQQDLARPGVVERFVGQETGAKLRQLFAGLWSLDDPSDPTTAAVIADAIQNPDRYVLKPQREGGGNNLYGQDLVDQLTRGLAAGGGEGLAAFILMQRILPPPQRGVFVRGGQWQEDESLSELGIYGTFLKVGDKVLLNEEVGHLVRTKTSSSNEGGVAAGFAVLDSPLLANPGEGLLHPLLEQQAAAAAAAGSGAAAKGGSSGHASGGKRWGADGGVLAVAKALLQ